MKRSVHGNHRIGWCSRMLTGSAMTLRVMAAFFAAPTKWLLMAADHGRAAFKIALRFDATMVQAKQTGNFIQCERGALPARASVGIGRERGRIVSWCRSHVVGACDGRLRGGFRRPYGRLRSVVWCDCRHPRGCVGQSSQLMELQRFRISSRGSHRISRYAFRGSIASSGCSTWSVDVAFDA